LRIFVSGSEGQLARCLANLEAQQENLTIIRGARPAFDLLTPADAKVIAVSASPDVIVNAAAYTAVDKAETEPELAFAINRDGAACMAEAAAHLNVPIIHVSTDYVFSGAKPEPYVETDATGPLGVYGHSKLAGEIAVRIASPRHAILRTSWVYSPYGSNFVKTMVRLAKERETLNVVSDQVGCPTSAADLATAILAVSKHMVNARDVSGTFHAAGTGDTSWAGFAAKIFEFLSQESQPIPSVNPILTKDYPTPAKRPANSRLNCTKLNEVFGVKFPAWETSLADCVRGLVK
jgi:dTDP-4-dehydrorhamnose reductase